MPRSSKRVLPVNLIDELYTALDLIGAVADLLALVGVASDPRILNDRTISHAAAFIESEASRLRRLIQRHEGIPTPNLPTRTDDDAI